MAQATVAALQVFQAELLSFRERMSAALARMNQAPAEGVALYEALCAEWSLLHGRSQACLAQLAADADLQGGLPDFEPWLQGEVKRLRPEIDLALARGCYVLGEIRAAKQHLASCLAHSEGMVEPSRTDALELLARLAIDAGRPDLAREWLDAFDAEARIWIEAAAWRGRVPEGTEAETARQAMQRVVAALSTRADLALAEGDRAAYLQLSGQALKLAEQAGATADQSRLWWARSSYEMIWDATGERLDRAEAELERCAPAAVRNQPDFERRLLQLRAHAWACKGKPARALQLLRRALEATSADAAAIAWTLRVDIADLLSEQGLHTEALAEADAALACARRLQSGAVERQCIDRRRGLQLASGDAEVIQSALVELDASARADELPADIASRLQTRVNLLLALKRHEEALSTLDELEALPLESLAGFLPPATLAGLRAGVLRDAGHVREAAAVLESAIEAAEAQPADEPWRDREATWQTLCFGAALQHVDLGDPARALYWCERGRERVWAAMLHRHSLETRSFELGALHARLAARRTALLNFVVGRKRTAVVVLPANGARAWTHVLPIGEAEWHECFDALERGHSNWNPRFEANIATFSAWLGDLLAEALEGAEQLVVVPDGVLSLVPFAGIVLPTGRAVAEEVATMLWPVASAGLRDLSPPMQRRLLSAGAGRSAGHDFSEMALEVARDAASAGTDAEALPNASVTDFLVRLPQFESLHLSFHGSVQPGRLDPLAASTLEFHGSERLSARALLERWPSGGRVDSVFLNACVSAGYAFGHDAAAGGFVHALLEAGAEQVIGTLAYVHPDQAQKLALAYRRYARGGGSAALSLQRAQLALRASGAPPSAWATHTAVATGL